MIKDELLQICNEKSNIIKFSIILISLFPVALLSRSAILNIAIILINFFYLIEIFKNKNFTHGKNFFFYLIYIYFGSLILNIMLNTGDNFSYERQIGFLRFVFFVLAINYFLTFDKKKYLNLVLKIWTILFFIVCFDVVFEFIFGFNTLGYKSYMPGRIASFLNGELKIGNFIYGFGFIALSYIINKNRLNFSTLAILTVVIISFLIGERSNFIKVLIGCSLLLIFLKHPTPKVKLLIAAVILIFTVSMAHYNKNINDRLLQITTPVKEMGLINYIKSSHYGVHYDTAFKIFLNNKVFGIGLKQFRYESAKKIYKNNPNNVYKRDNWATHPHQTHFEILSETGLFGYAMFISLFLLALYKGFAIFLKNRNIYLLSGLLFVFTSLLPILPSGSFFTTYTASIFWLNFSLITIFSSSIRDDKKN